MIRQWSPPAQCPVVAASLSVPVRLTEQATHNTTFRVDCQSSPADLLLSITQDKEGLSHASLLRRKTFPYRILLLCTGSLIVAAAQPATYLRQGLQTVERVPDDILSETMTRLPQVSRDSLEAVGQQAYDTPMCGRVQAMKTGREDQSRCGCTARFWQKPYSMFASV